MSRPAADPSVRGRLRQYQRREGMSTWVAGAFAGAIGLLAADAVNGSPDWLHNIIVTLVTIGVGCVAWARVGFEWEATRLKRGIEDGEYSPEQQLPAEEIAWPRSLEGAWTAALVIIFTIGLLVIVAAWWS